MTEAKVNLKGKYDELECGSGLEEEKQQHIIKFEDLYKNKDSTEFEYSKLFNVMLLEKLKAAKVFEDNFISLDTIRKG